MVLAAGCGANENDPDYWTPSHDPGVPNAFINQQGNGGAGAGGFTASGNAPGTGGPLSGTGGLLSGTGGGIFGNTGGIFGSTGGIFGNTGGIFGGTGGIVGGGGTVGTGGTIGGPPVPCTVTFTVTTGPGTGQFRPRNITAMWIATSGGQLVRSLEVYAATRIINLTKWYALTAGNKADAVSGATLSSHRQHVGHWDCLDASHNLVANGQYQAIMEWTDDDSAIFFYPPSRQVIVPFTKGAGPQNINAPDTTGFSGINLTLQ